MFYSIIDDHKEIFYISIHQWWCIRIKILISAMLLPFHIRFALGTSLGPSFGGLVWFQHLSTSFYGFWILVKFSLAFGGYVYNVSELFLIHETLLELLQPRKPRDWFVGNDADIFFRPRGLWPAVRLSIIDEICHCIPHLFPSIYVHLFLRPNQNYFH